MRHGSLFSGIGGFDLAAEWMGWENVFHCENNEFCQKILKYHFPKSIGYADITKTDFSEWRGEIDVVTGGFPCQPYSTAGKRKGKADDRHLWPQMLRAIREIQPTWIIGENVPGLLNWKRGMVLAEIKTDLEAAGFEVFPPVILPSCGTNAPHRRDRLWIVAYANKERLSIGDGFKSWSLPDFKERIQDNGEVNRSIGIRDVADPNSYIGCEGRLHTPEQKEAKRYVGTRNTWDHERNAWQNFPTQSPVCGGNDGVPNRVDRIKALGNAIVPKVAYEIFKAIQQCAPEK